MLNDLKQHISYLHPPGHGILDEPIDQTFTFEYLQNQIAMESNAEQGPDKPPKSMPTQCNLNWTLTCAPFLGDELVRFANTSKNGKPDASGSDLRAVKRGRSIEWGETGESGLDTL